MHSLEEENQASQRDITSPLDNSEISALLKASKTNSFVPNEKKVESNHTFYRKTLAEIASISDERDQLLQNEITEGDELKKLNEKSHLDAETNFDIADQTEVPSDRTYKSIDLNNSSPNEENDSTALPNELVENDVEIVSSNPSDLEKISFLENKVRDLEAQVEEKSSSQSELDDYLTLLKNLCSKLPPLVDVSYNDFESKIMNLMQEIIVDRLGYEISKFPETFAKKIKIKLSELHQVGSQAVIKMSEHDASMLEREFSKLPNITIIIDDTYSTGDYSISIGSLVLDDKLCMPSMDVESVENTSENP